MQRIWKKLLLVEIFAKEIVEKNSGVSRNFGLQARNLIHVFPFEKFYAMIKMIKIQPFMEQGVRWEKNNQIYRAWTNSSKNFCKKGIQKFKFQLFPNISTFKGGYPFRTPRHPP